jgi:hypothetical protein
MHISSFRSTLGGRAFAVDLLQKIFCLIWFLIYSYERDKLD